MSCPRTLRDRDSVLGIQLLKFSPFTHILTVSVFCASHIHADDSTSNLYYIQYPIEGFNVIIVLKTRMFSLQTDSLAILMPSYICIIHSCLLIAAEKECMYV